MISEDTAPHRRLMQPGLRLLASKTDIAEACNAKDGPARAGSFAAGQILNPSPLTLPGLDLLIAPCLSRRAVFCAMTDTTMHAAKTHSFHQQRLHLMQSEGRGLFQLPGNAVAVKESWHKGSAERA